MKRHGAAGVGLRRALTGGGAAVSHRYRPPPKTPRSRRPRAPNPSADDDSSAADRAVAPAIAPTRRPRRPDPRRLAYGVVGVPSGPGACLDGPRGGPGLRPSTVGRDPAIPWPLCRASRGIRHRCQAPSFTAFGFPRGRDPFEACAGRRPRTSTSHAGQGSCPLRPRRGDTTWDGRKG